MSHFTVLVFSEDYIELLEKYDENTDVEEYSKGPVNIGDEDEFLRHYKQVEPDASLGKSFEELYELFGDDWNGGCWRLNDNGVLESYSTYNPDSKWDWYQVGGRWNDAFEENPCLAKDIPKDFVPFAFIDHDGEWHEKGRMGWFAMVSDEKADEAWEAEYRDYLSRYDGMVTLIDCHI